MLAIVIFRVIIVNISDCDSGESSSNTSGCSGHINSDISSDINGR